MTTPNVPERIAEAARARMRAATAARQRNRVEKANRSGDMLAAEPDAGRKLRRMAAVANVDEAAARSLARGSSPAAMGLAGEAALGAERIQGKTTDFVGVYFLDFARAAAGCVARVVHRDGSPVGSGFLVSGRLFLTNNHVLLSPQDASELLLEFYYERDVRGRARLSTRFEMDPAAFFFTNAEDDLDFTLVAVGSRESGPNRIGDFGFCPIFDADDKHVLGEFVNIIQHPEGDYKQVVLRENQLVTRLETVLHYMADTSPGSSGSPVFNDQWEAVALHHYGEPFRQTSDADGRPVSRELNEGIRIGAIVRALAAARPTLADGPRALLDDALGVASRAPSRADLISDLITGAARATSIDAPAPAPPPREAQEMDDGKPRTNPDGSITLTVPLEITVRVAPGGGVTVVLPDARPPVETPPAPVPDGPTNGVPDEEAARPGGSRGPDRNYSNRRGYDPGFLAGFPIPFPKITSAAAGTPARLRAPVRGEDPTILKYEHFSIVMNADRKLAFVTAVNIDGAKSRSVDRETGKARPGVAGLAAGAVSEAAEATEKWYDDPRIPASAQTTQALYDRQNPRLFDRGHQVRREDPNWGTDASAERANADTFHFANCCPQASTFNQRAEFWQGIENYVLDNARAEDAKVSVFTGPVFAASDPRYRDVRVPVQFYKIAAYVEAGVLKAVALLASQAEFLNRLPERIGGERFDDLGRVRQYQTSVAEIEAITGIDFGPLRDADVFEGAEAIETPLRPIRSFDDLDLGPAPRLRAVEPRY